MRYKCILYIETEKKLANSDIENYYNLNVLRNDFCI